MKEQIIEWCKGLEWSLNLPNLHPSESGKGVIPKQTVEFTSATLPNEKGWQCRILVNKVPIYVQAHYYSAPNQWDGEEICVQRIMQEVFNYGVMASKKALEEYRKTLV